MPAPEFDHHNLTTFAIGSVMGLRSFHTDLDGYLIGPVKKTRWLPGINEAECLRIGNVCGFRGDAGDHVHSRIYCRGVSPCSRVPGDRSPGPNACTCGFYAYQEGSLDWAKGDCAAAVIEGFGRMRLGTRGFRCQKARIVAVYLPPAHFGPVTTAELSYTDRPTVRTERFLPIDEESKWSDAFVALITANYPGIPVYRHLNTMLRDFPTIPPKNEEES